MSAVLIDPWCDGIRHAIASRFRAGETVDDLAYDYEAYGITEADVHAMTKAVDQ